MADSQLPAPCTPPDPQTAADRQEALEYWQACQDEDDAEAAASKAAQAEAASATAQKPGGGDLAAYSQADLAAPSYSQATSQVPGGGDLAAPVTPPSVQAAEQAAWTAALEADQAGLFERNSFGLSLSWSQDDLEEQREYLRGYLLTAPMDPVFRQAMLLAMKDDDRADLAARKAARWAKFTATGAQKTPEGLSTGRLMVARLTTTRLKTP